MACPFAAEDDIVWHVCVDRARLDAANHRFRPDGMAPNASAEPFANHDNEGDRT